MPTCLLRSVASALVLLGCLASAAPARGAALPFLVRDIFPGPADSRPGDQDNSTAVAGSTLFFAADDGAHGVELWRSDGSTERTQLVADVRPGAAGSDPSPMAAVGDRLFFGAIVSSSTSGAFQLWTSDGTESGTEPLATFASARKFHDVDGLLLFTGNQPSGDYELWRSDGTPAGTVRVKDIRPGGGGSFPADSDNSSAVLGAELFFQADDGEAGVELWKSDGTELGTVLVKDVRPGPDSSFPEELTASGGLLFFSAFTGSSVSGAFALWASDGTDLGTMQLRAFDDVRDPHDVDGRLLFVGRDAANGEELWRSDGTVDGTELVADIRPGPAGSGLADADDSAVVVGDTLYFQADDGVTGIELWKSDGTAAGTMLVKDIAPGPAFSFPQRLTRVGDRLYFEAFPNGGSELWESDGTEAGTRRVEGFAPLGMRKLHEVGGVLVFAADESEHGFELWADVERTAGSGSASTDLEDDGATPTDVVETGIVSPAGGAITIRDAAPSATPSGYEILGVAVQIDATPATPANPLVLTFVLDASIIPAGEDETTLLPLKDGVPVPSCTGAGVADPDPCVGGRTRRPDGDVELIVRTSTASEWTVAVPGCAAEPRAACLLPTLPAKSSLALKNANTDVLTWKWTKGAATTSADLGHPDRVDGYALCIYAGGAGALVHEERAPAAGTCGTKPCWKGLGTPGGSKGWKYKDTTGEPDGLQSLVAKPGAVGKAKLTTKAKGDALTLPALPLAYPVVVQLQQGAACWEARFSAAGTRANDTTQFKAKSD